MKLFFLTLLFVATVFATAPSCENRLLAVGNTDKCDGLKICQADCTKIAGIRCTVPGEMKKKWASSLNEQLKKIDANLAKIIGKMTDSHNKHAGQFQADIKKATEDLTKAQAENKDTNAAQYRLEYQKLRLSQLQVYHNQQVADTKAWYEQSGENTKRVTMASIEFRASGASWQTRAVKLEKLQYQNSIAQLLLRTSQNKQLASLVYLQKKQQALLAQTWGYESASVGINSDAVKKYIARRKEIDASLSSARKSQTDSYKKKIAGIEATAKLRKEIATEKKRKELIKKTEESKKQLNKESHQNWKNWSQKIHDTEKEFNDKIWDAKKKKNADRVRKLSIEKEKTLKVLNVLRKKSFVDNRQEFTETEKKALETLNKIHISKKNELDQIKKLSNSLGNAKVAIPDNYVAPELKRGVLTLNFGASVEVLEGDLVPAYDSACIAHSSERTKLQRLLDNLERNIKFGVFPFNDTAAVELSNNDNFVKYWANLKEFCRKITDGLVPKDRALLAFFTNKWPAGSGIPTLIARVNVTENAAVTGVALFFDQLATWATTRDTARCACEDIEALIRTGIAPDNTKSTKFKRNAVILPQLEQVVAKRCVERYPQNCKWIKKPNTLEHDEIEVTEDVEDLLARISA